MFKKNKLLILIIITIIAVIAFFAFYYFTRPQIAPEQAAPNVVINNKVIPVEIADSRAKQIQGLSDRESLCPDCGMLFIFKDKTVRNFWMKNMHFPLDIIWIKDKKIVNISHNLPPEGEHPAHTYSSGEPVNYVLEVNAGKTDEWGIGEGDSLIYNF